MRPLPYLNGRALPPFPTEAGQGQTLISSQLSDQAFACGVDLDEASLRLGKQLSGRLQFVRATGCQLPFREQSFDYLISRVALPYMNIPEALEDFGRVLRPGGRLWATLHPFAKLRKDFIQSLSSRQLKDVVSRFYVLANGLALHFAGRQAAWPFHRGRCESFQTERGMRKALQAAGFEKIQFVRDNSSC